jgi:hypothetical protein
MKLGQRVRPYPLIDRLTRSTPDPCSGKSADTTLRARRIEDDSAYLTVVDWLTLCVSCTWTILSLAVDLSVNMPAIKLGSVGR